MEPCAIFFFWGGRGLKRLKLLFSRFNHELLLDVLKKWLLKLACHFFLKKKKALSLCLYSLAKRNLSLLQIKSNMLEGLLNDIINLVRMETSAYQALNTIN